MMSVSDVPLEVIKVFQSSISRKVSVRKLVRSNWCFGKSKGFCEKMHSTYHSKLSGKTKNNLEKN